MSGKNVGGGSIFLKILIVVLIGVLYISVDLPSKQWKQQAADRKEARLRLQNLNTAALQYLFFNRRFPQTFEDIRASLDTCVLHLPAISFSADDKQLDAEILRDSLLISAEDTMRIAAFDVEDAGKITTADGRTLNHTRVWARMLPQYAALTTDTFHIYCEEPIKVWPRGGGVNDFSMWASAAARFDRTLGGMTKGDSCSIKVTDFSFSMAFDSIFTCPTTGKPFDFKHVAKYGYSGEYLFEVDGAQGSAVTTRGQQEGFLSAMKTLVANEVALQLQSIVDSAKTSGNLTFQVPEDRKNSIVNREVLARLASLKNGQKLSLTAEKTQIARADSADFFTANDFAETILFPQATGSGQEKQYDLLLADASVQAMLPRMKLNTMIAPVKVDTAGVALYSPIVGDESYLTGWKKIFEVDPPENHGYYYNGTSSWE
jgi:hypothetical protein